MEIAIVKNGEWLNPRTDDYIKQFPRYDELIECYEDGERPVGAYVPVDLIEDLFKHLCKGVQGRLLTEREVKIVERKGGLI